MAVRLGGEARSEVEKARAKPTSPAVPAKAARRKSSTPTSGRGPYASDFSLVRKFPLEPIRDDAQLDQALAVVEGLLKRELDDGEESYLEVLTTLVEAYECRAFPIHGASEADVLRELMRENGLNQSALAGRVGMAQPTISAVLSGARELTKVQVLTLARFFHVSPTAFMRVR